MPARETATNPGQEPDREQHQPRRPERTPASKLVGSRTDGTSTREARQVSPAWHAAPTFAKKPAPPTRISRRSTGRKISPRPAAERTNPTDWRSGRLASVPRSATKTPSVNAAPPTTASVPKVLSKRAEPVDGTAIPPSYKVLSPSSRFVAAVPSGPRGPWVAHLGADHPSVDGPRKLVRLDLRCNRAPRPEAVEARPARGRIGQLLTARRVTGARTAPSPPAPFTVPMPPTARPSTNT
jgi:hypothetical protein